MGTGTGTGRRQLLWVGLCSLVVQGAPGRPAAASEREAHLGVGAGAALQPHAGGAALGAGLQLELGYDPRDALSVAALTQVLWLRGSQAPLPAVPDTPAQARHADFLSVALGAQLLVAPPAPWWARRLGECWVPFVGLGAVLSMQLTYSATQRLAQRLVRRLPGGWELLPQLQGCVGVRWRPGGGPALGVQGRLSGWPGAPGLRLLLLVDVRRFAYL